MTEAVARHMREHRIPGLSLAVGRAGRVIFARGYGEADLEHGAPVTPATLFRLQSTQKLLTATAVLRLAELGRLRLDDPVQRHCPAFGVRPWPVTVGDLLTHQGGVRPSDLADLFNRRHYASVEAAVRRLGRSVTLSAAKGTMPIWSPSGRSPRLQACEPPDARGRSGDHPVLSSL
jgi:CubicO group peptidase (beta-lactamase class C family)